MDQEISSRLRITFLIHAIVSVLLGSSLWLIPGRTLELLDWIQEFVQLPESNLSISGGTFVDPLITRLLGAALLAFAFASFQGWRSERWAQVSIMVQMEAIFCVLSILAFIATAFLTERSIPLAFWGMLVMLVVFALFWGIAVRKRG